MLMTFLTWRSWLDGVLPMILDVESSVQSKCLEVVGSAIFSNLVSYDRSSSDHQKMAWSLLNILAEANNVNLWFVRDHLNFFHLFFVLLITARCCASVVCAVILCPSVCSSVCLSVTNQSSTKMVKPRLMQTAPYVSPGTLVYWRQKISVKFERGHPNGDAK